MLTTIQYIKGNFIKQSKPYLKLVSFFPEIHHY